MKKIILAFDGTNFSEGAFEFTRMLNELQAILLVGAFLPRVKPVNLSSNAANMGARFFALLESNESVLIQQNIERFQDLCLSNNIEHRVHRDFDGLVLAELKKESCFADLLIIGSQVFYDNIGDDAPNSYLRDALHDVKSPVLLVPEEFDFPENVILAYDGSKDSVFAIKQFAYLFPELTRSQTVLVYVNDNVEKEFPDKSNIEELVGLHFGNVTSYKLDINPKKYFSTWMWGKKSTVLVSGSYGRSGLSRRLRKSFITDIISDHRLPVFIAHN